MSYTRSCGRCGRPDAVRVDQPTDAGLCGDCRAVEPAEVRRALVGSGPTLEHHHPPTKRQRPRTRA